MVGKALAACGRGHKHNVLPGPDACDSVNLVEVKSGDPFFFKGVSQTIAERNITAQLLRGTDISLPGSLQLYLPVIFEKINNVLYHDN